MKRLNLTFRLKPIGADRKFLCRVCGFPVRPARPAEHRDCEVKALAELKRSGTRPGQGDAR